MARSQGLRESVDERCTTAQFRTAIDDVLTAEFDDYYLSRWLRARKFDVIAAELMLRRVSAQLLALPKLHSLTDTD